jgi:glycosyltransferase involved in cell wall biosynthesis
MLRLLMLGTVNHPHVEHLAIAMADRGIQVTVGGDTLADLPGSVLAGTDVRVRPSPSVRRNSARGIAAHVRWIRRLIREERPDVVHAHWLPGFAFCAALAGARPLVAMAWGSDVLRARPLQRLANRVAIRRSTMVMADSQALIDAVVELGAKERQCALVSWGVDLSLFRPATPDEKAELRRELGLRECMVVLGPRSLMPVYNPRTLVEAWSRLAGERDDVQLVLKHMGVRGDGVANLPFADRVHVVGHVEYERMAQYYRVADVCVSIPSSDSAPRSVFEAMACGVPCVLSDLPWVHEQLRHERDALVVPIEASAVAAAIGRLLDDRALATAVASHALAHVQESQDSGRHMDALAHTYRSLAA